MYRYKRKYLVVFTENYRINIPKAILVHIASPPSHEELTMTMDIGQQYTTFTTGKHNCQIHSIATTPYFIATCSKSSFYLYTDLSHT